MKHLYLTLILLFTLSYSYAQKEFREAYIVQNGDTLKGYIVHRSSVRNAQEAIFKTSLDSPEQTYTPAGISAYGFLKENRSFDAVTIPATGSAPAQALFLEALVKGKATIYYYRDGSQTEHYFVKKEGENPLELIQQKTTTQDQSSGKVYLAENNLYLGLLSFVFSDCYSITRAKLEQVELSAKSLISITQKYNACVDPGSVVQENASAGERISISATLGYAQPTVGFGKRSFFADADFQNESSPLTGGISINSRIRPASDKFSLQLDLLYVSNKFSALVEETTSFGRKNNYDILFDLAYLKLPLQFRYTYSKGKLRPFVNAGIVTGYAVKDNHRTIITSTSNDQTTTETAPAVYKADFRRTFFGATGGAGVSYDLFNHPVSLEARYEQNNGFTTISDSATSVRSVIQTLYLLLSFGF